MTQLSDYMQKIAIPVMNFMSLVGVSVEIIESEVQLHHIIPSKWMSFKYTNCTWIVYLPNKIENHDYIFTLSRDGIIMEHELSENDTITIKSSGIIYSTGMFEILNKVIIACSKREDDSITNLPPDGDILPFYLGFYGLRQKYSDNCTWAIYEPTDIDSYDQIFVLDEFGSIMDFNLSNNDSITVNVTGKSYPSLMYEIRDNGVLVYENQPESKVLHTTVTDEVLTGIVKLLFIISFVCLNIKSFHFLGQRAESHLQLALDILFIYLTLLIAHIAGGMRTTCTIVAIFLNYWCLAAFIWMNVTVVNMCLDSRQSDRPLSSSSKNIRVLVSSILGWGIPLVLTLVPVGVSYIDIDEVLKPEFSGPRCWFTQTYAMLLYFGILCACSVLLNIPSFVLACRNIHRTNPSSLPGPTCVYPCDKIVPHFLFFLMMTITWIFGIISEFTETKIVHFIFAVLCSLQGVFLLVCFRGTNNKDRKEHEDRKTLPRTTDRLLWLF